MLDNIEAITNQDKLGVLKITEMLADQCNQAWLETQKISLPEDYHQINHVVVAGMGGSHLGAQLIKAVYNQDLNLPLIIQSQYTAPGYISPKSLVIATSFSGNTEEIISFSREAIEKHAKIICICSGGELAKFALENQLPYYVFDTTFNPSKIPRYGSGYLFISQLSFLAKLGVISLAQPDIDSVINILRLQKDKYSLSVPTETNPAKQLASHLHNRQAILVASQHLSGSAYIFKNQINESAKNLAVMFEIPELNHHLLEGLAHPTANKDVLAFVFIESDLYHPRVQARYPITQSIVNMQHIPIFSFKPSSPTKLTQAFETLAFTNYVAFYLSILNQVDPGPNPWVDQLKSELNKIT